MKIKFHPQTRGKVDMLFPNSFTKDMWSGVPENYLAKTASLSDLE